MIYLLIYRLGKFKFKFNKTKGENVRVQQFKQVACSSIANREAAVKYYPYSIYVYYFRAVGRKTNHSLKSQETRSQASRQKHWLICVSK